jgi:hypothetical protein
MHMERLIWCTKTVMYQIAAEESRKRERRVDWTRLSFRVNRFLSLPGEDNSPSFSLDDHCGAIRKDLGNAGHDLVCIVAHTDNGIGTDISRMLDHQGEGILSGLFTEFLEERDISSEEDLYAGADVADDRS